MQKTVPEYFMEEVSLCFGQTAPLASTPQRSQKRKNGGHRMKIHTYSMHSKQTEKTIIQQITRRICKIPEADLLSEFFFSDSLFLRDAHFFKSGHLFLFFHMYCLYSLGRVILNKSL